MPLMRVSHLIDHLVQLWVVFLRETLIGERSAQSPQPAPFYHVTKTIFRSLYRDEVAKSNPAGEKRQTRDYVSACWG